MAAYDEITVEALRLAGGLKWSAYPDTYGAFVAEMDFGIAPPILEALHEAVDGMGFGYLTHAMARSVGAACADFQREQYGWAVRPEQVHPVADVLQGMQVMLRSFAPPGCPLVLPTPAYMPFVFLPPMLGREVIQVPMVEDGDGRLVHDLDALEATFARVGSAVLILVNPHNPSGTVATAAELAGISEVVDRHDVRVFADEVHAPLVYAGGTHVPYATVSAAAARHTVTATSASKGWNVPGLKCAQLIFTNPADQEKWPAVSWLATSGVSNLGVVASVAAYTAGGDWLAETVDYLGGNRRELDTLIADQLPGVRYRAPQGTYLAWLDCRPLGLPDEDLSNFFRREAGVALIDGRACGEVGAGHVRLNFATPRPVLRELVTRMGEAVDRLG